MWWLNNKNHKILSPKIDPTLGRWAKAQREMRNNGQMDEKRIELLNGIQFPWVNDRSAEPQETDTWSETYENLKNWWKVRKNYFFPHMQSHLKEWAKEQAAKKKTGELPKDKIALLDHIEFPWDMF